MNFFKYIMDLPILIVLIVFISSTIYCYSKYAQTGKNLNVLIDFMSKFKRNDLNFRFKEIDNWMMSNPYFSTAWLEFRNTLVFSESVALKADGKDVAYKDISTTVQNVQTTSDPLW